MVLEEMRQASAEQIPLTGVVFAEGIADQGVALAIIDTQDLALGMKMIRTVVVGPTKSVTGQRTVVRGGNGLVLGFHCVF